jgi:hypothetical protein
LGNDKDATKALSIYRLVLESFFFKNSFIDVIDEIKDQLAAKLIKNN